MILQFLRNGWVGNSASVPTSVPKPSRSVPQVSVAHDIIAFKDAPGLVARQIHGHAFGDAGADHVPDGRSPEIVRDTARAPGGHPRPSPSLVEAALGDAVAGEVPERAGRDRAMEEHVLHDHVLLPLDVIGAARCSFKSCCSSSPIGGPVTPASWAAIPDEISWRPETWSEFRHPI